MDYEKFNYLNEKVFFISKGQKYSFSEMYDRVRDHYLSRIFRVKNFQKKAQISREETKALDGLFEIAESALIKGKSEGADIECYRIDD